MLDAPVSHCAKPCASAATRLMTHVLSGAAERVGIGRGGPKRQSTLVQLRLLAVSVVVKFASVMDVWLQGATVVVDQTSVVEVVMVEHGDDDGWQRSLIPVLAFFAFARILQLLATVPCFFALTVTTPVKPPHTELVLLALTLTFPIPPAQRVGLAARIFLFLRSCGVQPASGWLMHSSRLYVHLLPTAFAEMVPPSATVPLV